ncbi:hypothetical protein TrLO_g11639 [Triparma laevis f. longispina]|uniref:Uncharacterized protein n=1 Tax=Triparma laevis f. longispina TaxID=1714387 RepID=A0A9W7CGT3_9STRA|nr:hypothetical protein TrLO_g11639 [Triparma laevis f. longispina]
MNFLKKKTARNGDRTLLTPFPQTPDPPAQPLNVSDLFRTMTFRRLMRQYHGTYAPSSKFKTLWVVGFLMWTFGLLGVSTSGAFNVSIDYMSLLARCSYNNRVLY